MSIYWWLRIAEGVGLVWLMGRINFSKIKLAGSFVISMVLSVGLGIYQFLTQSAFASKWLGLAAHWPAELGASVVENASGRWLRAYGSLPHPNVLAGFIVIAMMAIFWMIQKYKNITTPIPVQSATGRFSLEKEGTKIPLLLYYFITLLLTTGLFFTFSRGAWLVGGVLCIMYLVLCIKQKKIYQAKSLVIPVLLFVVCCLLFLPLFKTRILSKQRLEVKSNIERVAGYGEAWQIIKNSPILGAGAGNYTVALQKLKPGLEVWNYQPVHNVYILVFSEVGIAGIILLICLLMKSEKRKMKNDLLLVVSCWSLVVLFLFDHFWWTLGSGVIIIVITIGTLLKNKKDPSTLSDPNSRSG